VIFMNFQNSQHPEGIPLPKKRRNVLFHILNHAIGAFRFRRVKRDPRQFQIFCNFNEPA